MAAQVSQKELVAFMAAIRLQESSNNYKAVGPTTRYGRATGAYQFLNSTWNGYGGYQRAMDAPPAVQDARAAQLMSQYYGTYGNWGLVSVAWHAGPGNANRAQKYGMDSLGSLGDGLSRTVDYARKAVTQMNRNLEAGTQPQYQDTPGGGPASQPTWYGSQENLGGGGGSSSWGDPVAPSVSPASQGITGMVGGTIARQSDDPLGTSGGGPGTIGSGGGGGGGAGITPVATSFGDGTLDLSDTEKVDAEVEVKYGEMSDEEFLTEIYKDVLGRDPDKSGFDFWLGQLGSGMSRSDVYRGFYASDEGGNTEAPLLSEVELMIRQKYPDWAWALDNPEVRDILLEATDPTRGMDDVTFQSRIRDTEWWKTTESTVREWDARSSMDPATAQREIEKLATELGRRATSLGAVIEPAAAARLAEKVLRFGLSESEINDALAATFDSSDPRGDVAANLKQARALARSHMVVMSDDELVKWAQEVAVGTASPDDLEVRIRQLAKAKFGQNKQLLEMIDAGVAPATYFSEHQRMVARELDMSPDQVDLLDPKYARVLSSAADGVVRPMDLDETRKHIRENAEFGWESSSTGRAKIADTTQALLRAFGKVA